MKDLWSYVEGISSEFDGQDEINRSLALASQVGLDRSLVSNCIQQVVLEQIVMWLIGPVDPSLNFIERKIAISSRLEGLDTRISDSQFEELVTRIAAAQALVSQSRTDKKSGIRSIDEGVAGRLLSEQGNRCGVCGVCLRSSVRRKSGFFRQGIEPISDEHLDHEFPFYASANRYLLLLCKHCNTLKNDRLGIQEDGISLCGNHVRPRNKARDHRRMSFWRLSNGSGCDSCDAGAQDSLLLVYKKQREHPWVLQNIGVVCLEHTTPGAFWLHGSVASKNSLSVP